MKVDPNTDTCPMCGSDWCFEEHEPWPTCGTCQHGQDIRPGRYRCRLSSLGVRAWDFCSKYHPADGKGQPAKAT